MRRPSYDDALEWYRKSLGINEDLGDRSALATSYHQLGVVLQKQGAYSQALEWYRKSLEIKEGLGDRYGQAQTTSQLGVLATQQERPAEAVPLNLRSLAIHLEIGSSEARVDLYWLTRQHDMLGDERFQELLAQHVGEKGRENVLKLMAEYEEVRGGEDRGVGARGGRGRLSGSGPRARAPRRRRRIPDDG